MAPVTWQQQLLQLEQIEGNRNRKRKFPSFTALRERCHWSILQVSPWQLHITSDLIHGNNLHRRIDVMQRPQQHYVVPL